MHKVKCFISYSRDSVDHETWVRELASTLQRKGVETALDQWDCHPGTDLTKYMEASIRESEFVLMVCTPMYKEKADAGKGGVGYEKMIITGEIFEDTALPEKFVPILCSGIPRDSLPSFLKSKKFIDFRDNSRFDLAMDELLRHIYGAPKYRKPPLGSKPLFDEAPHLVKPIPKSPMQASHSAGSLERFKEVYSHAYSMSGLNLNAGDARAFATDWIERFAEKDFQKFKEVYSHAYSMSGLNLNAGDARAFAITWMEKYFDKDFARFKEAYHFAYSFSGMNLNRDDAMVFALKHIGEE